MTKKKLAKELRERQIQYGAVSIEVILSISDEEIIDSYNTCSCCGVKLLDEKTLTKVINESRNCADFLDTSSEYANSLHRAKELLKSAFNNSNS